MRIIDVPGTYSLDATNKAEQVAVKMLDKGDVIINVVDATNLERNLYLTLQLLEQDIPMVVALNMWDETHHLGIKVDLKRLEDRLGVPVVPTAAIIGQGINNLVNIIPKASVNSEMRPITEEERWASVGKIVKETTRIRHRHHTIMERMADATVVPGTGIPIALLAMFLVFMIIRFIGEGIINFALDPIFEGYRPYAMALYNSMSPGLARDVLIGRLINGEIDYLQSMGLLTTGFYVPLAMVLPYIISFYFVLSVLEDIGYLPRLAVLVDNVFHKIGLHGHSIVTVFLGLGCNVPGALSTRVLETKKQRFISATLLAISVPCMAQIAMVFGILGRYGILYIGLVFITLAIVYVTVGTILNRIMPGESPELFLEIPPYRKPSLEALFKKTWMRVRAFIVEAVPFVFLGVLIINAMYMTGFIDWLGIIFGPLITGLWGLPEGATAALLVGFLRKDVAVGMLLPLGMSPMQLVIAATVLTVYFPCIATFIVLFRELGWMDMAKATAIMLGTAFIVGVVMRLILLGV
jgi:ferrous iron transport protein B